jgi:ribosome biogenesis protein Nip4
MMQKIFDNFVGMFTDGLKLEPFWIGKQGFLVSDELKKNVEQITQPVESVGTFLGTARGKHFEPSIALCEMLAEHSERKVFVNDHTEWLFLCGRDVLAEGIQRHAADLKKSDFVLVQNRYDENLGLGKVVSLSDRDDAAVRHVVDRGDFLRRE